MDTSHKQRVCRLYKQSLKLAFDWYYDRRVYKRYAASIREQFEKYRGERNPGNVSLLLQATEYLLHKYRHPEPYKCKHYCIYF